MTTTSDLQSKRIIFILLLRLAKEIRIFFYEYNVHTRVASQIFEPYNFFIIMVIGHVAANK